MQRQYLFPEADRLVTEPVHISFGVGGQNYASSFYVIGEIFDPAEHAPGPVTRPLTAMPPFLPKRCYSGIRLPKGRPFLFS